MTGRWRSSSHRNKSSRLGTLNCKLPLKENAYQGVPNSTAALGRGVQGGATLHDRRKFRIINSDPIDSDKRFFGFLPLLMRGRVSNAELLILFLKFLIVAFFRMQRTSEYVLCVCVCAVKTMGQVCSVLRLEHFVSDQKRAPFNQEPCVVLPLVSRNQSHTGWGKIFSPFSNPFKNPHKMREYQDSVLGGSFVLF